VLEEPLLDVGHAAQRELGREDAGVLALVLLEDVGLHRAADGRQHPGADLLGLGVVGLAALLGAEASRRWSIAVVRNIASTAGAGPLIVIDTDVVGEHRSNPS
jgi:hypothetical protein